MKTLFFMTLYGTAMILLIMLLRGLLKHRLSRRTFKALWILAALRLVVPIFTVWEIEVPNNFSSPLTEYIISEDQELPAVQYIGNDSANNRPAADISVNKKVPLSKIIFALWISGAAAAMSVFAALYLLGTKRFRSAKTAYNSEVSKIIGGFSVRKKVRVKVSDEILSPLTYGIIHPIILLPASITDHDSQQIKYIISHEMIHIKNNDLLLKLLVIFALCLHWFNPMVWMMLLLFNKDTELSCDEEVIRRGADRESYALTLISFKEKQIGTVLSNSFGKNAISERIESIMKFKKSTTAAVVAAIAVIACTAAAFAAAPEISVTEEADSNTYSVTVSNQDAGAEQTKDNTLIVNYSFNAPSDTDVSAQTEVNRSDITIFPEDDDGNVLSNSDTDGIDVIFYSGSLPENPDEQEEVTAVWKKYEDTENVIEFELPPKSTHGVIKHVPEDEYADGEDAVQVLADMFSGEDDFTYPIDSIYNGLYHYDGGFYITAAKGENICSMLDGTVIYADMANFPFGNAVIIDHENGNVCIYAHCDDLCVSAGDEVKAGDIIAHVGSTGDTTDNALYIYRYQ